MSTKMAEERQSNPPRHRKPPRVHLEFINPMAGSVCIAVTFNNRRSGATPMIYLGAGRGVKDLASV